MTDQTQPSAEDVNAPDVRTFQVAYTGTPNNEQSWRLWMERNR